jgi:hypothetical protein
MNTNVSETYTTHETITISKVYLGGVQNHMHAAGL